MTPQKVTGIIAVGLVVIAAFALSSKDKTTTDKTTADKVYAEMMPPSETTFIATMKNARQQYNAGANEMAKGATRPARKAALCNLLTVEILVSNCLAFGDQIARWFRIYARVGIYMDFCNSIYGEYIFLAGKTGGN